MLVEPFIDAGRETQVVAAGEEQRVTLLAALAEETNHRFGGAHDLFGRVAARAVRDHSLAQPPQKQVGRDFLGDRILLTIQASGEPAHDALFGCLLTLLTFSVPGDRGIYFKIRIEIAQFASAVRIVAPWA